MKTQFTTVLAVVGLLLSGRVARAADYVVQIGADTQSGQDASLSICQFDQMCHVELKELGLQVDIDLRRAMSRIVRLHLRSHNPDCCYFEYGRDVTVLDLREALHQEPIFKGEKVRDGMTVENVRIGSLFLKFRLLSPDWRDDRRGLGQPL
jgi:hypothetical protein